MTKLPLSALRRRLRQEDGVSMIITLGVLLVTSSLLVAVFTSSIGEIKLTSSDTAAKKAYYAAQAGISDYMYHLTQDSNYLTYCTSPSPANPALNQLSEGTTHRAKVAGTTDEEYPIDHIEFGYSYKGDEGYSNEGCGSSASPSFKGTHIPPAEVPSLKPPPSDEELEHVVEPAYHFTEKTEIILEGTTMTIKTHVGSTCKPTEACAETKTSGVAFPSNGVIYVSGGCSSAYSPFGPKPTYTADTNCGNVYVRGEYTLPLTIASQNDVVINGNILAPHNSEGAPTSTAMLGLIANNFIRVYHPLEKSRTGPNYTECGSSENASNDLKEPTVYAAMLALKHAVIADNFDCGKPTLGHLNVFGAVAALYSNGLT